MNVHRIVKQFRTVQDWMTNPNTRIPCRAKCGVCAKRWRDTGTAHINLIVDTAGKQFFTCTACVEKIENEQATTTTTPPCE